MATISTVIYLVLSAIPARAMAGGLAGVEKNPLGARPLYLFKDGKDTLYRIGHQ